MKHIDKIKNLVMENGYKLTPQRLATIEIILKNKDKHLTTEEIFTEVKKAYPNIGLATVYRTILLLDELKILTKHNFDDGKYRYELNDSSESHHHHHLICSKCSRVLEVEDLLTDLEEKIEKTYKFKITNHNLQFFGLCDRCIK